jgi:flagellar protein FliL
MPDAAKNEKKSEGGEAAEEAKPAPKAASSGSSKLVPALLAVNSLILAAVLVVVVLRPEGLGHHASTKDAGAKEADAKEGDASSSEAHGKDGSHEASAGSKEGAAKKEKDKPPGPTLRLPDFVIHLKDADTDRYARISFEIEVADEKAKEAVNARLPVIRDAFLAYLSDRSAADLRGGEAMAKLKSALGDRLAEVAAGVPVHALYVTELVVQ